MSQVHLYIVLISTDGVGKTQSTSNVASHPNIVKLGVNPALLLTIVLYAKTEAFDQKSQLSCTPSPLVMRVLWKCSTGIEDRLYGGVVMC